MKERSIKIIINSDPANVPFVGNAINKFCLLLSFSEKVIYQIELSVVEALNNCIKHAYSNNLDSEIEIEFVMYSDKIKIYISDKGKSINKEKLKSDFNFDPDDIPNLPERGMGLFIINKVMDEVTYKKEDDKNILIMTKMRS